jgi:hypothetical protein
MFHLQRLDSNITGRQSCPRVTKEEHILTGFKKIFGALLVSATLATGAIAAMPASGTRTATMGDIAGQKGPTSSSCPRRQSCECEWKEVDGILWCWPK